MKDVVNVDNNSSVNPDVFHDLNVFPYPFKFEDFDTILMLNVLEHLKYPRKVVVECFRILKENGKIIVSIPTPLSKYYRHPTHVNFFEYRDLKKMFGLFEIKIIGYRGNSREINPRILKIIGFLFPSEWILIGRKK